MEHMGDNTPKKSVSSFSLGSLKKSNREEQNKKEETGDLSKENRDSVKLNESFSQEKLEQVWQKYYQLLLDNRKYNLASLLNMSIPKVDENFQIIYEIPTKLSRVEIEKEEYDFLRYLKDKLRNETLSIQYKVVEQQNKKYYTTSEEKLEKLIELHPDLKELIVKFNLTF